MVMTDPIADFLTRIRNANMVKHESLEVPASYPLLWSFTSKYYERKKSVPNIRQ